MSNKAAEKRYRFGFLLFFLLIYLFGSPFLHPYPSLGVIAHVLLSTALCFAVYAVQKAQNYRSFAMILLIPVLVLYWLGLYDIIPFSRHAAYLLLSVFYALLILAFTHQLARAHVITLNEIFATLCLYLIVGLLWGALYGLLYDISPGSYAGALLNDDWDTKYHVFNYFSLVTLTTLGYGDIAPQTPGAAALCQLEAVVGQFFIAVVVAWLVGNFVSEKQRKRQNR